MIKKFNKYLNKYISETAISAIRMQYHPILQEDDSYEDSWTKCYDFMIANVTKKKSKLTNYHGTEILPYAVIGTVIPEEDKIVYTFIPGGSYSCFIDTLRVVSINNFSSKIKLPHSLDDDNIQNITENKNMLENIICKIFFIDSMTNLDISWKTLKKMSLEETNK